MRNKSCFLLAFISMLLLGRVFHNPFNKGLAFPVVQ